MLLIKVSMSVAKVSNLLSLSRPQQEWPRSKVVSFPSLSSSHTPNIAPTTSCEQGSGRGSRIRKRKTRRKEEKEERKEGRKEEEEREEKGKRMTLRGRKKDEEKSKKKKKEEVEEEEK